MFIFTSDQMREADHQAIVNYKIPSIVLMENAALSVTQVIREKFPEAFRAVILAGKGNNGGDGLAVARHLFNMGWEVQVFLFAPQSSIRGDAAVNLRIVKRMGIPLKTVRTITRFNRVSADLAAAHIIIDALFGTGLTKPLTGYFAEIVEAVNAVNTPVLAVDIPSGMAASTSRIIGPTIVAETTVTFGGLKVAHLFPPTAPLAGEVVVADIGIPFDVLEGLSEMELLSGQGLSQLITPRDPESHKGTFGHVVIVAGSADKPGAAALAARAAYRSGSGLVTVASVRDVVRTALGRTTEVMGLILPGENDGTISPDALPSLVKFCRDKEAVLIGPGLGTTPKIQDFIRTLTGSLPVPVILDADALSAFAGKLSLLKKREAPTIITPHPGEMARLLHTTTSQVQEDRIGHVRKASMESGAVTVLKGYQTLITAPGGKILINPTGNPGMATGGMGDVLGGIIASLTGRGISADMASALGVYLHGTAGDLAVKKLGEASLMAGDVVSAIPDAFQWLRNPS